MTAVITIVATFYLVGWIMVFSWGICNYNVDIHHVFAEAVFWPLPFIRALVLYPIHFFQGKE